MDDFARIYIMNQNPVQTEAMVWVELFKSAYTRDSVIEDAAARADLMLVEFHKRFQYIRDLGRYGRTS